MSDEKDAIQSAVEMGVPLAEAQAILARLNMLVESGDWVPLHIDKPRFAIGEFFKFRQGTSVVAYWGPKEFAQWYPAEYEEVISYGGKQYHQLTRSKAENLLHKCKVAKMHEIVTGSAFYPTWVCRNCNHRNVYNNSTQLEVCEKCHEPIDPKQQVAVDRKRPDMPAGRPLHRHWEIYELWHYLSKNRIVQEFIEGRC